jgi:hypothetical protein
LETSRFTKDQKYDFRLVKGFSPDQAGKEIARKALLFLGLNAIELALFFFTINRSNAQSLDNSNKDYHD